jgi:predicted  nucleic acid-binding Zn-ribbon protein
MMNRFLGFSSLGLATLALVVALANSSPVVVPAPLPEGESPGASAPELQALEKRVQALEGTVQLLSQRLREAERRPGSAAAPGEAVPPAALAAEVDQLKDEIRGLMAGEALNSEGGREYLKDMMTSVQGEMRDARRREQEQRWVQAMAQAQLDRNGSWKKFVTDAGLNTHQEQQLMRRLEDEDSRRKTLIEEVRAGTKQPRDMQRELREARKQTDEEMQKLLGPDQQRQYLETRRDEWRQARGGGGPGGPPGGQGGPGGWRGPNGGGRP